ncbi:hypothetical protein LCGC14_1864120 [marine sediment metagenome]|uniref:Phage gp6-like head-tail connector protein n=1 Tax=marine sediment metagenome TaxID=412755 RepID=A0A0F9G6Y1_9ZZZZ
MTLTLITAPVGLVFTLAEVKAHLRVEDTANDEDALILSLMRVVQAHLDGCDAWLGRALLTQTWDLVLDRFPGHRTRAGGYTGSGFAADAIRVPLPPLVSVTSVKYTDTDGVEQTWGTSNYTVDINSQPGRIVPAYGEIWPSTRGEINAVTVRLVAGYGDRNAVPMDIKHGMLLMIGHLYEHREEVIVGTIVAKMPMAADALLGPYQVWDEG